MICETNIWQPDCEHFHSGASYVMDVKKKTKTWTYTRGFGHMRIWAHDMCIIKLSSSPSIPYTIPELRKWHHMQSISVRFIFQLSQQSKCCCEKKWQKKTYFCWFLAFSQTLQWNLIKCFLKTKGHCGAIVLNYSKDVMSPWGLVLCRCQISLISLHLSENYKVTYLSAVITIHFWHLTSGSRVLIWLKGHVTCWYVV